MPPLISLIVATLGRSTEMERFLEHADKQSYCKFELIVVVDQNSDGRLEDIIKRYESRMAIIHLRCSPGLSKARNAGIRVSSGEIIAFPDDDCWYPPSLLESIVTLFGKNTNWDGLTGRIVNEMNSVSGDARFDTESGYITLPNLWRRVCSATIFFTRETVEAIGNFDEELGPGAGTPWGGADDIDYVARAIKAGRTIFYDPKICVFHPDLSVAAQADRLGRAYSYGAGMGRVWMKQKFPARVIGYYLLRPLVGVCVSLVTGRWMQARYRWAAFQGRLSGLMSR
ncbi:MAG TPA: glycosyltransferase [Nitrospiraceae bacterium]|nr:glycosyltransferase [Nitrospiraceae bacterium]